MRFRRLTRLFVLLLALTATGSVAQQGPGRNDEPRRLPNGSLQSLAILKHDHKNSMADVNEIIELAEELKRELEKNEGFVLSIDSIKKAEEIEKLAKKIRSRMRRR
jgi:hypothetical protein